MNINYLNNINQITFYKHYGFPTKSNLRKRYSWTVITVQTTVYNKFSFHTQSDSTGLFLIPVHQKTTSKSHLD